MNVDLVNHLTLYSWKLPNRLKELKRMLENELQSLNFHFQESEEARMAPVLIDCFEVKGFCLLMSTDMRS